MRDEYDFSNAIRNPFAGRFNGKYTVTVHYDFTKPSVLDEAFQAEHDQPMTDSCSANPPPAETG